MWNFATVVANQSLAKIICAASVETLWLAFALENVNPSKLAHFSDWLAES